MTGPGSGRYRLLAVGSLPPPLGGTSVSFQIFCDEARRHLDLEVVDAAPHTIKEDSRLLRLGNLGQALRVMRQVLTRARHADAVLVVGSHQFLFTVGSMISVVASFLGRPCYLRSFGYLDQYYAGLPPALQWLFRKTVGNVSGLLVETRLAQAGLEGVAGATVYWIPGYRVMPDHDRPSMESRHDEGGLRLVYLSQVREEKGIFLLLESLRADPIRSEESIHCDIYGPVFPSVATRFFAELSRTPNATYCGVIDPDDSVRTLSRYDVLVFPSFWAGEGHPGVVMEAMMAGISVIATDHRSLPELVDHGVNGLLIEPGSSAELADAVWSLHTDRRLLQSTAARNWERRTRHSAEHVVAEMLEVMRPPV